METSCQERCLLTSLLYMYCTALRDLEHLFSVHFRRDVTFNKLSRGRISDRLDSTQETSKHAHLHAQVDLRLCIDVIIYWIITIVEDKVHYWVYS